MLKSDLVPGLIVEYRDGQRRLVIQIKNKLCLLGESKIMPSEKFENYDNNLIYIENGTRYRELDIVNVYEPIEFHTLDNMFETFNLDHIYSNKID